MINRGKKENEQHKDEQKKVKEREKQKGKEEQEQGKVREKSKEKGNKYWLLIVFISFVLGYFARGFAGPQQQSSNTTERIKNETQEIKPENTVIESDKENKAESERLRFEVLDWETRVFYYPEFLSKEESDALLSVSERLLEKEHGDSVWSKKRATSYFGGEWTKHKMIMDVERRVAMATKIPIHQEEMEIMLAFTGYYSGEHDLINVHHDLNGAENRVATAVIYLADVEEGGYTMFPCLGNHTVNKDLANTFTKAFYGDTRRVIFSPPHWNNTAFGICSKMCRGEYPSLKVQPKKGSAVIFFSRYLDGLPDPHAWHGACRVHNGRKITLQKFKEFPRHSGEWVMPHSWTNEKGSKEPPKWVKFNEKELSYPF